MQQKLKSKAFSVNNPNPEEPWLLRIFSAMINDRLSYEEFVILFLLLQEKNQKKQVQGALYVLLPQSKPPPCRSPGRIAGHSAYFNLNPVQAENVPIFCLKFGAEEIGRAARAEPPPTARPYV